MTLICYWLVTVKSETGATREAPGLAAKMKLMMLELTDPIELMAMMYALKVLPVPAKVTELDLK